MRAQIYITIEDDTTEEKLTAAGMSRERLHDLYYNTFRCMLADAAQLGCRADLRVEVDDNHKSPVRWSRPGPCPTCYTEQFDAIYNDDKEGL